MTASRPTTSGYRFRLSALLLGQILGAASVQGVVLMAPVVGDWLTEGGDGVIQIAPCAESLCGRIVGITRDPGEPMPLDVNGHPQCGLTILSLNADARDGIWSGRVTDPRNGTAYRAEVRLDPKGRLLMRGYIGIPLLGQTQVWRRFIGRIVEECRFFPGNGSGRAPIESPH